MEDGLSESKMNIVDIKHVTESFLVLGRGYVIKYEYGLKNLSYLVNIWKHTCKKNNKNNSAKLKSFI